MFSTSCDYSASYFADSFSVSTFVVEEDSEVNSILRSNLDSYATMVVAEKNTTMLRDTRRHAEMVLFTLNCVHLHKMPIVDAIVDYWNSYLEEIFFIELLQ